MNSEERVKALYDSAERLLRDLDAERERAPRGQRGPATRRRNAVNSACNALWKALRG